MNADNRGPEGDAAMTVAAILLLAGLLAGGTALAAEATGEPPNPSTGPTFPNPQPPAPQPPPPSPSPPTSPTPPPAPAPRHSAP